MRRHGGASSDGCLVHVFRHAAKELFNEDVGEVTYRTLRCAGWAAVCLLVWAAPPFRADHSKPATCVCVHVHVGGDCPIYGVYTSQDQKAFSVFIHRLFISADFQT